MYTCLKTGKYFLCFIFLNYPFHLELSFKSEHISVENKPVKQYIKEADQTKFDSLYNIYGKHKILPSGFELPALMALSHYPTLKDISVEFKFTNAKVAHTARPSIASVFYPKRKRKYVVSISNSVKEELENTRLVHLSYNAQIGVLGHELAHIEDYINLNFFQLIGFGIQYMVEKGIVKIENRTDHITINHGLGYQLLKWSEEVHDLHIKDGRGERYLAPNQIIEAMSMHESY